MLTAKGATYETEDGALWLRSTDFGCDKDDVLRRANGFYTYFAADIAYHATSSKSAALTVLSTSGALTITAM